MAMALSSPMAAAALENLKPAAKTLGETSSHAVTCRAFQKSPWLKHRMLGSHHVSASFAAMTYRGTS